MTELPPEPMPGQMELDLDLDSSPEEAWTGEYCTLCGGECTAWAENENRSKDCE